MSCPINKSSLAAHLVCERTNHNQAMRQPSMHTQSTARGPPTTQPAADRAMRSWMDGGGRCCSLEILSLPVPRHTCHSSQSPPSPRRGVMCVNRPAFSFFLGMIFFFTPSSAISWLRRARVALAWLAGASSHAAQQGLVVRLWAGGAEKTVGLTGGRREGSKQAAGCTVAPPVRTGQSRAAASRAPAGRSWWARGLVEARQSMCPASWPPRARHASPSPGPGSRRYSFSSRINCFLFALQAIPASFFFPSFAGRFIPIRRILQAAAAGRHLSAKSPSPLHVLFWFFKLQT